ncbi:MULTISPECIES: hypothetical protein [Lactobacillaceae]|uniref:hypothetical protein n=1 Tax=Lactobacillaceae TaxID=33958 RepID=UPI0014574A95|nr:hypothetical protein [Lactobacillus sp. HBUAS51381]NLR09982.1 hypothetical protein [Lactobacillus sp. HBUAS51381]
MGLFDIGNKKEAYKRGIIDASESTSQKLDEVSKNVETSGNNVSASVNLLKDDFDDVNDILTSDAKEKLLGLVEELNYRDDLESSSKEFLVAILITLSLGIGKTSDAQQRYLRSIKSYLSVDTSQKINLRNVENITDSDETQLIFRSVNEYLYLYDGSFDLSKDSEFLDFFDFFNINNHIKREILEDIQRRVLVMGSEGLIIPFEVTEMDLNAQKNEDTESNETIQSHTSDEEIDIKNSEMDVRQNKESNVAEKLNVRRVDPKMEAMAKVLRPLTRFHEFFEVSIYPDVNLEMAKQICSYNVDIDFNEMDIVAVCRPTTQDACFGEFAKSIGLIFLKDRIISNRKPYGGMLKSSVQFNVVMYSDLVEETSSSKEYIAYNGVSWELESKAGVKKMAQMLHDLKATSVKPLDKIVAENKSEVKLTDNEISSQFKALCRIVEPLRYFKENVSIYPNASIEKAKLISGFHYLDIDEDNVLAVMTPNGEDGIFGWYGKTIGVIFLRDRIISNRLPNHGARKNDVEFSMIKYVDIQVQTAPKKKYVKYNDINWEIDNYKEAKGVGTMLEALKETVAMFADGKHL